MHMPQYACGARGSPVADGHFFHHIGPKDQTQVLSSKHVYPLCHLPLYIKLKFLTKQCVVAWAYHPSNCEVDGSIRSSGLSSAAWGVQGKP